ncbi:hypothetical protein Efla_005846 [Eimeria flavescens]
MAVFTHVSQLHNAAYLRLEFLTCVLRATASALQGSSLSQLLLCPQTYKPLLVLLADVGNLLLDCGCVLVFDVGEEYSSSECMLDRIDFTVSWVNDDECLLGLLKTFVA